MGWPECRSKGASGGIGSMGCSKTRPTFVKRSVIRMGFFDQYPRFYATSHTSPVPHRLNARYAAVIDSIRDKLTGARVLDIASHDGRWSFAALKAGAAHVIGIEPRSELIDNAHKTFAEYGIDVARCSFVRGDVFEVLCRREQKFDVVMCLGFFYHTIRHVELLDLIERTGARLVVIDTEVTPAADQIPVTPTDDPRIVFRNPYMVQLLRDPVDNEQMAWKDSITRDGYTIVGRPSRASIEFLARHFGFECSGFDWPSYFASHDHARSSMVDYDEGWRGTFYLRR